MELLAARASTESAPLKIKKILVALDFSPLSEKAFHYAVRLARQFKAELTLLHILEPIVPLTYEGLAIDLPDSTDDANIANKTLKEMAASARAGGIERTTARVGRGLASHELVEIARELDVDLIVIATHGYSGWKHFCIGSTAERVVRAAHCPVFVVREKEHDFN